MVILKKILNYWIFINYCYQRVGLWPKKAMLIGMSHIFSIELAFIFMPFILLPYTYFGGKNTLSYSLLIVSIAFYLAYLVDKKYFTPYLLSILPKIESQYARTNKFLRIIYFIFGFLLAINIVLVFIFSFRILNYL